MRKICPCVLALCCFATVNLSAATVKVASLPELSAAISKASAGTEIVLANGVYTSTNSIRIAAKGTARRPITISAESIGGAEINGTKGFHLEPSAAYVVIKGFKISHEVNDEQVAVGASHCRYTRCTFELPGNGYYLMINGDDTEIDHNTFQNKTTVGQ